MKVFGSVLVFFAELGMLAGVAWWGFAAIEGGLAWAVGLGLALAIAVVWGIFLAPKATRPLPRPAQYWVRLLLLLSGAAALFAAGATALGVVQAALALVGTLLADSPRADGPPGYGPRGVGPRGDRLPSDGPRRPN